MKTFWTIQIEWQHNDSEQGTYSWCGWAEDYTDAERQCRTEMYNSLRDEDEEKYEDYDQSDIDKTGGVVVYAFEGANIYAAVEVARHLEILTKTTLIDGIAQYVLDMLRPSDDISWEIQVFAMAREPGEAADAYVLADSEHPPLPIVHYDIVVSRRTESTGEVETFDEYDDLDRGTAATRCGELEQKYPHASVEWV